MIKINSRMSLVAMAAAMLSNGSLPVEDGPCRCGAHDCPDRPQENKSQDDLARIEAAKQKRARRAAKRSGN